MRLEYRQGGNEKKDMRRSIRNSTPVQQILRLMGRQQAPEPPEEVKMSMDRANFIKDESTGVPLNEALEPQRGVEGREVNFSPELYAQYETFLYNYSMKLSKLKETPPPPGLPPDITSMYDLIIASPIGGGEIDARFYETVIGNDGKPDDEKIAKFLETSEGWMLATGMMEQQRALTIFAMGLDTAARNTMGGLQNADRGQNVMGRQIIRLGTGQGAINRLWNNASNGQRWGLVGGLALGAGAAVVGGPLAGLAAGAAGGNALLGAVAGGAANVAAAEVGGAAIAGIMTGIQRGDYIDVQQCTQAWEYVNSNTALRTRLQYMSGLDTQDYVSVGGRLEIAPGRIPQSVRLQENLKTAMSIGVTSQQFYDSLGIDPGLMDSSREEFITHNLGGGQRSHEQGTTYLEERAMRLLDINDPNIGDRIGHPGVPWGGLEINQRLELYHAAKRKAMMEMFNTVTDKLVAEQTDARLESAIDEIDRKISALGEGGEAETKAREPLTKNKQMLSEVNEGVDGKNGLKLDAQAMEAYTNALKDVTQARDRLQQVLGTAELAAIDRELNLRNGVSTEKLQQLRAELAVTEAALQAQLSAGEAIDNRINAIEATYDRFMDIDGLLRAQGLPEVGLTPQVLQGESTDEIIRRINLANIRWAGRLPPLSETWPGGENMSPIHRSRLYLVIAEAQARNNPAISAPTLELSACVINNITENFLRTATPQEIADRMRGVPALAGLAGNAARINELVIETQTRFSARSSALKDVMKREEADRTEYNASLQVRKTQLDNDIQRDKTELTTVENEERALNALRNIDTQGAKVFEKIENDYLAAYDRVSNWHTTRGIADLDPTSVAGYNITQLRDILTTNGLPMPTEPAAQQRFLIAAISEAQARAGGGMTDPLPGVDFAIASLKMTERQVRDWTDQEIFTHIDRNKLPRNIINAAQLQEIQAARAELQSRRDARVAAMVSNIKVAGAQDNFLRQVTEFKSAEDALNAHLIRLGVTDRAALQTRIDTNVVARSSIRELDARVGSTLTLIDTEDTAYATALKTAQAKRSEIASQLNGANTIAQLDRLINLPIDELRELRTKVASSEQVVNAGKTVEQYYESARELFVRLEFNAAVTALYAPGRELNAAALSTISFQEAITRMNELHVAGRAAVPPVDIGWPAAENDQPENRIRLARSMEEARWRALNGPGNPDFNASVLGSGTPEHLLLSMTAQEAIAEINRRAGAVILNPALPADVARVEAFRTIAQTRMQNRVRSINATVDANTRDIRVIDRTLAKPDAGVKDKRMQLEEMRRSIIDRGERMSAMNLFVTRPTELTLMAPVSAADLDLTPAEQTAVDAAGNALPRAVVEMYDILFKYKQRPDREATFKTLIANLPPQDLINTFVREIPVLAIGGPPADATQFVDRLRTYVDRRRVTSHELRRVIGAINNNFEGRALAMAA